jgi:hypothetical protein
MVGIPFIGKKKAAPSLSAVQRVKGLSDQGFSEPEIIRTLRREGYSPVEVDRAIKSAIRDTAASDFSTLPGELPRPGEPFRGGMNLGPEPPSAASPGFPELSEYGKDDLDLPAPPGMLERKPQVPEPPYAPEHRPVGPPSFSPLDMEIETDTHRRSLPEIRKLRSPHEERTIERGEMEEIIEGLIEEKWDLVERELGEFEERMKGLDGKLKTIEDHVNLLKEKRREDQEDIKSSVTAYKEAVGDLSMKIESIEKAMKDSLSPMLQTLRSLSDTLKMMKEK